MSIVTDDPVAESLGAPPQLWQLDLQLAFPRSVPAAVGCRDGLPSLRRPPRRSTSASQPADLGEGEEDDAVEKA